MPDNDFPPRSTPFPNRLLDEVMPSLKDTEWRILCVVLRATMGWEMGSTRQRKKSDWLTHTQLQRRTGRRSEAVCRAIDALVKRGLIRVEDETGNVLATPQARQVCQGKLFYQLGPTALQVMDTRRVEETPGTISESVLNTSQIEIAQSKTTKETEYKKRLSGVKHEDMMVVENPEENAVRTQRSDARDGVRSMDSDVQRFLDTYREQFMRQSARGEPPPICWGRDARLVKGLLTLYGYERLVELLKRFFQSEDPWVKKRGYALYCFPPLLPRLLIDENDRSGPRHPTHAPPVVLRTRSDASWSQAGSVAVSDASLFERHPELARRVRGQPP